MIPLPLLKWTAQYHYKMISVSLSEDMNHLSKYNCRSRRELKREINNVFFSFLSLPRYPSFAGCLRNVTIEGNVLDLSSASEIDRIETSGCPSVVRKIVMIFIVPFLHAPT